MHTIVTGGALRLPAVVHGRKEKPAALALLARRFTPRTVFMDIGAEDCGLALAAASYVERVYAIDVSGAFIQNVLVPLNVRLVLCNGVRIPVPGASIDVAWSGRFMEHLHPDDRLEHLKTVRRLLAPGGVYVTSVRAPFREAGFAAVKGYAGAVRVPAAFARVFVAS